MLRNVLKPLLGIPIGISIVDYVGYVARVDGPSMRPTLNEDPTTAEYVFLNKVSTKLKCVKHSCNQFLVAVS